MKWVVTKDHINTDAVGKGNYKGDSSKMPFWFRLYDDDEILYYEGRCDAEDLEPLDWAINYAGCTMMFTSSDGATYTMLGG